MLICPQCHSFDKIKKIKIINGNFQSTVSIKALRHGGRRLRLGSSVDWSLLTDIQKSAIELNYFNIIEIQERVELKEKLEDVLYLSV